MDCMLISITHMKINSSQFLPTEMTRKQKNMETPRLRPLDQRESCNRPYTQTASQTDTSVNVLTLGGTQFTANNPS